MAYYHSGFFAIRIKIVGMSKESRGVGLRSLSFISCRLRYLRSQIATESNLSYIPSFLPWDKKWSNFFCVVFDATLIII